MVHRQRHHSLRIFLEKPKKGGMSYGKNHNSQTPTTPNRTLPTSLLQTLQKPMRHRQPKKATLHPRIHSQRNSTTKTNHPTKNPTSKLVILCQLLRQLLYFIACFCLRLNLAYFSRNATMQAPFDMRKTCYV
jgi:hypothetical protein